MPLKLIPRSSPVSWISTFCPRLSWLVTESLLLISSLLLLLVVVTSSSLMLPSAPNSLTSPVGIPSSPTSHPSRPLPESQSSLPRLSSIPHQRRRSQPQLQRRRSQLQRLPSPSQKRSQFRSRSHTSSLWTTLAVQPSSWTIGSASTLTRIPVEVLFHGSLRTSQPRSTVCGGLISSTQRTLLKSS